MTLRYIAVPGMSSDYDLFGDPWGYSGDLFAPSILDYPRRSHFVHRPRRQPRVDNHKDLSNDPNKFQVLLNVKHFKPEDLSVKTVDNFVVVHGKHEEKVDEHGLVTREFTRRYAIPEDVEPGKIQSSLSQDGVLTIQAPRKTQQLPQNERVIPINMQKPAVQEQQQKMEEDQKQQVEQSNAAEQ